jgi:hypothetical protein
MFRFRCGYQLRSIKKTQTSFIKRWASRAFPMRFHLFHSCKVTIPHFNTVFWTIRHTVMHCFGSTARQRIGQAYAYEKPSINLQEGKYKVQCLLALLGGFGSLRFFGTAELLGVIRARQIHGTRNSHLLCTILAFLP